MPYPNHHSCDLRPTSDFQDGSFRTMKRSHEGKSYNVIIGRLKGEDATAEQSYRYPKDEWIESQARAHCKSHDGVSFDPATGEDSMEERGAIGSHQTPTSDAGWDGPANEARVKSDQSPAYYGRVYAWRDPDQDGSTKGHYKFIHHEVSGDGTPGAANLRGCSAAIGVLNGGRGGTTIPDSDRRGVWNHMAAHLRDGDREPPPLRAMPPTCEHRSLPVEFRVEAQEGQRRISWYAALFDVLSEEMGGFRERIGRRAFTKTLQEHDIRALVNHDPNLILARTSAGSLKLKVDLRGLHAEAQLPDTSYAADLVANIENGNIRGGSFAFVTLRDAWTLETSDEGQEYLLRTLHEVKLFDVSAVTFPAYIPTEGSLALRSLAEEWRQKLSHSEVDSEAIRARIIRLNNNRHRQLELLKTKLRIY